MFLRRRLRGITDVAERQLCTGCGVCAFVQPEDIRMVDDVGAGRRPIVRQQDGRDVDTTSALRVCPGVALSHGPDQSGLIEELRPTWGPVLELWEGYATDDEVRLAGSSGGAATVLARFCLDHEDMAGVLHTRARADVPYLNETVLSTTAEELMAATGSRYAPASPCDGLARIVDAERPCVFIGKPCDVAATDMARKADTALDENLGLTIAVFCAGTPTTRGTFEMLAGMGIDDPSKLISVRYRGNGWPGDAEAVVRTATGTERRTLTYDESWGDILQRHRQWRCYVCADHTGEFADIAVGDPWYREIAPGESGRSLVVVRTERGRELLHRALARGVLVAERVAPDRLPASQPGLLSVRGAVGGRVAMSRILGIPAPRYRGLPTWHVWFRELSVRDQLRSTLGLIRRAFRKGLFRRHPVVPLRFGPNDGEQPPHEMGST
jgi:coenzyme F420 hydrogenase subunit beta